MERVVLVDGSAMVFRAFFAIPMGFSTEAGLPTNASYGFALMFRKIFGGKRPTRGAVVFDAPGRTFRDEAYPEYKAQRPAMPGDLRRQLPSIQRLVETHGFPTLKVEGYEADDVIGTLARAAVEAGHEVHVISGDKDFAQLVSERVRLVDTVRDVSFDPELVRKKWGVPPRQFADYLALVGDKIDNIPGVPGIGQKTAVKLLETHGDVEGILAATDTMKGKRREVLESHAEQARLSLKLATIDQHVPASALGATLADLAIPDPDPAAIDALYRELEFYSLLSGDDAKEAAREGDYAALASAGEAEAYLRELGPAAVLPVHALPSAIHGRLLGIAFAPLADGGEVGRYLALHGEEGLGDAPLTALKVWAEDPERPKVTHDARDLHTLLGKHGVTLRGIAGDTRLGSFLVDPTRDLPHALEQLTKRHLQRTLVPVKELVGGGKKRKALASVARETLATWACHHAGAIASLWPEIDHALAREGRRELLDELSLPMARVLARMQLAGVKVDGEELDRMGAEFEMRKAEVEARIHGLAGRPFNIASSKQLGEVLFDELKLPILKRTKTGYSTAADVLERLAKDHEIAALVLEQRALAKLINTYTRVLKEAIHPGTGRVHASFQQTVGASGRLITTDPDLQRTPIRTGDGRRIRAAFVAPRGSVVLSADWSQIELRILAHITGDDGLREAFREGLDVHRRTAAQIYGVAPDAVTPEQRNVGKTVNFATIYGQGATALGQQLGLPRAEAKALIERYFEAYAGVRAWIDGTVADAHANGYVETLLGRRRYIPELRSNNFSDRGYGERVAANTPIQGSAADLCKLAMLDIDAALEERGMKSRMLLQIHDELVFEAPEDEADALEALVRDRMENAYPLEVPLVVDVGRGASWAEAH
ncbi:MAG: DNA polymerase I [Myxococcota bacterium]